MVTNPQKHTQRSLYQINLVIAKHGIVCHFDIESLEANGILLKEGETFSNYSLGTPGSSSGFLFSLLEADSEEVDLAWVQVSFLFLEVELSLHLVIVNKDWAVLIVKIRIVYVSLSPLISLVDWVGVWIFLDGRL